MAVAARRRCYNVKRERRVVLTVRNVPTLPAEGSETLWWDEHVPGFYLAVHPPSVRFPRGVRSYGVWYRVRGRQRQKRLGRHPVVILAVARERAREILEAARVRGVDLGAATRATTIVDVVEAYVAAAGAERPRTRADSTLAGYLQMVDADLRDSAAARIPVEELRRRDLVALLKRVAVRAPIVASRLRQLIVAASRWAVREEIIDRDPTFGVERLATEQSRDRVLSDDEIAILWRACAEEAVATGSAALARGRGRGGAKWTRLRTNDERAAAVQRAVMARLLLLTAQRSGETSLMEWSEIDPDRRLWNIPAEHRKGQRGRRQAHVVPLSELAKEELRLWSLHPLVGSGRRVFPWAAANHRHWVDPLRDRARTLGLVDHWTPHDLRRTAATGMARLGFSRSVIAMVLGHTVKEGGAVTQAYDRFDRMPERRAALDAWGAHVAAVVARARS